MKTFLTIALITASAITFAGCEPGPANTAANSTNAANTSNTNAAKPTSAAPTTEALLALEKSAHEAFKNKDAKFWETFLANNFVGFGPEGRLDRAAAMKLYAGTDCDVKSVTVSDEKMTTYGTDAAILTTKVTTDGTCGGNKIPTDSYAASGFVRDGDKWKGVFHGEVAVTDPKAAPAKAAPAAPGPKDGPASAEADNALATALLAIENKSWEAWKARDSKTLDEISTSNFQYLSSMGLKDKAESTKFWTATPCEIKSFALTDPQAVSLTKDLALITYKGSAVGTCEGKPVPPMLWVASFNMKEGDTWKNAFYMDVAP